MLMCGVLFRGAERALIRTRRRNGEGQRMISALLALKEGWMRVS